VGVLICLHDWPGNVDWTEAQARCEAAMARLGRSVERHVYHVGKSTRARIRKTPLIGDATNDLRYLGVYNFDGGEVNLPCPHAAVVCYTCLLGKTFYLFDDQMPFEQGPVAGLSAWLAEMWPGAVGYALPHDRVELPEAFAGGSGNARPPRSTEDTTAWIADRRDTPVNERTRLRDMFEVNILHTGVLARTFGGQTLEAWIEEKPARGSLVRTAAGVVLWTIALEHLSDARDEARSTGITYPRDPFPQNWRLMAEAFAGLEERQDRRSGE
jgi:hypothetical protein